MVNGKLSRLLMYTILQGLLAVCCNGQDEQANIELLKDLKHYTGVINSLVGELKVNLNIQHEKKQHLLVGDLEVTRTGNRYDPLKVKLAHRGTQHYYYNKQVRGEHDCDQTCLDIIEGIWTKREDCLNLDQETLHTELLYLYGRWGRNALEYSRNYKRITLLYSWYIPCADNCHSYGECAGELAHYRFIGQRQGRRNYFIVVYSEVYSKTSDCQSQVYQTMGGIPVIRFNEEVLNDDFHIFLLSPMFFPLPRGIINNPTGHSRLGIIATCLNRAAFLDNFPNSQELINYRNGLRQTDFYALDRADMYIYIEWTLRKELFRSGKDTRQIVGNLLQIEHIPGNILTMCLYYVNECYTGLSGLEDLPAGFGKSDLGNRQQGLDDFLISLANNHAKLTNLQREVFRTDLSIESERMQLHTHDQNQQHFTISV